MEDEARGEVDLSKRTRRRGETGGKERDDTGVRLHKASSAAVLKKLLFEITDHNGLDKDGNAPLHCFVKRKDKEKFNCLITFLIHSKCDVSLLNGGGQTALHLACQENDVQIAKALIAFDAKINAINIDKKTPLDVVLQHHSNDYDELEILLLLLGGMRYQEIKDNAQAERVDGVNGTATHTAAEADNDVFAIPTELPDSEYGHRQPSKGERRKQEVPHSDHNETKTSPLASPVRHKLTSSLSTLLEEGAGDEEERDRHLAADSNVEMGLTSLAADMARRHLEESESSHSVVSSSSILKNIPFLSDNATPQSSDPGSTSPQLKHTSENDPRLVNMKEKLTVQANGEVSSTKATHSEAAGAVGIEEADLSSGPMKGQQQQQDQRQRAHTSPEQFRRYKVNRPGNVHPLKSTQHNRLEGHQRHERIAARRRNIFYRQNSDMALRSVSEYNPGMEVMHSIIGQSVVPVSCQKQEGLRILCLDGGGMKGLIQIEILKTIEQMTGKSISELFDWVVGTSTGGILALGMIYGELSLEDLRRLYFSMKDTVFKRQSKLFSHVCDTKALEDLLKGTLGTTKRMNCIKKPNLLIAAVDKSTTLLPLVFFSNCLDNDYSNELVWKVARYTSAAPVFFAEYDNYVDGGVKANNPTTYGLAEIQEFLSKKYGRGSAAAKISCVVSLGCGIYPPEPLGNTDIADALKIKNLHRAPGRLKELLTLLTTALSSSEEISRLCRINCEHQGISYFRFSPEIGEDVGTTEKDNHKLCQIIIRAKQLFKENAEQVESMIQQLSCKIKENYLCHI